MTGSRALEIIWSPEETQLPLSGEWAPPTSLPDAMAGTLLRGHYGWDIARNHEALSVLLCFSLAPAGNSERRSRGSHPGQRPTPGKDGDQRGGSQPAAAAQPVMNRPKVCCLISIASLLKQACDKGYIDVLHGMRRAAHMCRGGPFGEAVGGSSMDPATEQHSPWNRPGGCGWAERAQTRVYEVMEDLLGWLSWDEGPGGVGAEPVQAECSAVRWRL